MAEYSDHTVVATVESRLQKIAAESFKDVEGIKFIDLFNYGVEIYMEDGSGYHLTVYQTADEGEFE